MKDTDKFILKNNDGRKYTQTAARPAVGVTREIYARLQQIAYKSGISVTKVASQAIEFALDRLEWK